MKKIVFFSVLVALLMTFTFGCSSKPASKEAIAAAKGLVEKATKFFDTAYGKLNEIVKKDKNKKAGKAIAAYLTGDYLKGLKAIDKEGGALIEKHKDFKTATRDKAIKKEVAALRDSVKKLGDLFKAIKTNYKDDKAIKKVFDELKKKLKKKK